MRLLVLGGTRFLGRHIVESALRRGHEITLFNRGQSNPGLFPTVRMLKGDRDGGREGDGAREGVRHGEQAGGLDALRGGSWDAVVDTCGYVPRIVASSARLLADAVDRYVFISTISVYPELTAEVDETSPVGTLADETVETVDGDTYGPLKVLCERAVEAALPGRALNVRAGLIVGPHDPTDRFTYWPRRIAEGGRVLAPGRRDAQVQFIDVRDIADWVVASAERRTSGTYNVTGPRSVLTIAELLETCRDVSGCDAELVWATDEFLVANGVEAWMGLPMWLPGGDLRTNCRRAIDAGLAFRPLADTVRDTLEWARTLPADRTWRAGIPRAREAELLAAWDEVG